MSDTGYAKAARPTPADAAGRDGPWVYVLLSLLGTAGFFYVNLAAVFVDGLVGALGFTHAQAGTVMSANIYGSSLGGLVAVFVVKRLPWRPVLAGLLGVVLLIELASMTVHSYAVMLPLRVIDGVVGGLSVGVALSLLARTRLPDRAFGALLMFQFAFGGLGSWLLPGIVASHGMWVVFACMAAMDLVALATALFLRLREVGRAAKHVGAKAMDARRMVALPVAVLLALFLFQAAQMGLFAFIIPLGEASRLALPFISSTVGWTTWIGALGSLFVIVFGTKLGRAKPLGVAMAITLVGIAGLFLAEYKSAFFTANALTAITWSFVVPYLFGMVSVLDRSGRMATLAGFVSGLGLASGPLVAGWLVRPHDYAPVIGLSLAFFVVATVAMLAASMRVDARDRALPETILQMQGG